MWQEKVKGCIWCGYLVRVEWQPMGDTWGKDQQLGQRVEERVRIHLMSVSISFLILAFYI